MEVKHLAGEVVEFASSGTIEELLDIIGLVVEIGSRYRCDEGTAREWVLNQIGRSRVPFLDEDEIRLFFQLVDRQWKRRHSRPQTGKDVPK